MNAMIRRNTTWLFASIFKKITLMPNWQSKKLFRCSLKMKHTCSFCLILKQGLLIVDFFCRILLYQSFNLFIHQSDYKDQLQKLLPYEKVLGYDHMLKLLCCYLFADEWISVGLGSLNEMLDITQIDWSLKFSHDSSNNSPKLIFCQLFIIDHKVIHHKVASLHLRFRSLGKLSKLGKSWPINEMEIIERINSKA